MDVMCVEMHSGFVFCFVYVLSTHQQHIQDKYHKLHKKPPCRTMQIIDAMWLCLDFMVSICKIVKFSRGENKKKSIHSIF